MANASDPQAAGVTFEAPTETGPDLEGSTVVERLLEHVPASPEQATAPGPLASESTAGSPVLRTARVANIDGSEAQIVYRGRSTPVTAKIDAGVDRGLVARAMAGGEAVLVEVDPEAGPVIVGTVQTRAPEAIELKARRIVVEAEEELLLRSGRAAVRLRADGDLEVVGSRISMVSRGLYRIVGRLLRLN